ncbi:MAG: S9 family peptidase [Planctomycetota bacterium]
MVRGVLCATWLILCGCQLPGSDPDRHVSEKASVMIPMPKKVPVEVELHGDVRVDPYAWMREKDAPEVLAHLAGENAYADALMQPTEALQERLYQEMLGRIQQTDLTVPYRKGQYQYYTRTEEGKQYDIHCRRRQAPGAPEEVLLDVNQLAEGEPFMAVGDFEVSPDGTLLAFTTDNRGFREYTLQVKDLASGKILPDRALRVSSVAWAGNGVLYYTTDDVETKRSYRVFHHVLGSSEDSLVFEETDERFSVGVELSRSERFVFLGTDSLTTSEVQALDLERPELGFRMIAAREQDHEYEVDHHGDSFIIRSNDRGRNFRVASAPIATPERAHWTEILPHDANVMRTSIACFRDHLIVRERADGLPRIRVVRFADSAAHLISFDEPTFALFGSANPEYQTSLYRFTYSSLTTPSSIYEYDLEARTRVLLKRTPVLGGFDPADYVSERIAAVAADGTRVPISLVYHRKTNPRAGNPLLLTGYGSYGIAIDAAFSITRVSLLDRGAIFAIAHIRGGGELGKPWHDAGRMFNKMNTFGDFIACADHLVAAGYTRRDRLVIEGGSAGGLLVGAVTNMRPDLCQAVISEVPFVDVLNTMLDEDLPLTVGEFEEWGNPKIADQYGYIRQYCPYTNLAAKDYPAMLVRTSYDDSQVMYWEPAKYVARLRELKTDANPLIFKINMAGGHGGSSGRYDRLREIAFDYAFFLWQVGAMPPASAP